MNTNSECLFSFMTLWISAYKTTFIRIMLKEIHILWLYLSEIQCFMSSAITLRYKNSSHSISCLRDEIYCQNMLLNRQNVYGSV